MFVTTSTISQKIEMQKQQELYSTMSLSNIIAATNIHGVGHQQQHQSSSLTKSGSIPTNTTVNTTRGGRSFPRKLYAMLQDAEAMGFSDIVTWQPDGKSFKVLKPKKFEATIMQRYFLNQTKYKSFQRQLNIYGFQRIHYGPSKGGYSHQYLVKDAPELCRMINRQAPTERLQQLNNNEDSNVRTTNAGNPMGFPAAAATAPNVFSHHNNAQEADTPYTLMSESVAALMDSSDDDIIGNAAASLFSQHYHQQQPNPATLLHLSGISSASANTARHFGGFPLASAEVLGSKTGVASSAMGFQPAPLGTGQQRYGTSTSAAVYNDDIFKVDELLRIKPLHGNNRFHMDASEARLFSDLFRDFGSSFNGQSGQLQGSSTTMGQFNSSIGGGGFSSGNTAGMGSEVIYLNPASIPAQIGNASGSSSSPNDSNSSNNNNGQEGSSSSTSEHVFPRKLHRMLEDAEKHGFENIVSWVQGGAAFKVHDSDKFVEKIMPAYFDQTKYESFRRQLNLYGFSRVSRGANRGIYFHEFFLESDRTLCRNITRARTGPAAAKAATSV